MDINTILSALRGIVGDNRAKELEDLDNGTADSLGSQDEANAIDNQTMRNAADDNGAADSLRSQDEADAIDAGRSPMESEQGNIMDNAGRKIGQFVEKTKETVGGIGDDLGKFARDTIPSIPSTDRMSSWAREMMTGTPPHKQDMTNDTATETYDTQPDGLDRLKAEQPEIFKRYFGR